MLKALVILKGVYFLKGLVMIRVADHYNTYIENQYVKGNVFLSMEREEAELPVFESAKDKLPQPFWQGRETAIDCYWKVWQIAFQNLRRPNPQSGFIANYIDTAFNNCLFMWDSAFILLFARYGSRVFNFQRTLDNFYAKQHPDGFICREIQEWDGLDRFERFDPASTGPNVMPWVEWEYFLNFGDGDRLSKVFPPLLAYHNWLKAYRTWKDGSYWTSGWACGMDNQPRLPKGQDVFFSNGRMSWIDATLQQILSAKMLIKMAGVLDRKQDVSDLEKESEKLTAFVNKEMWNDDTGFYFDKFEDGSLSDVKTIGAYWALISGAVPPSRLDIFIRHLENPKEFNRTHRIPSLSADHAGYIADGGYWQGGVWAPTNYMTLRGLSYVNKNDLAFEIAKNHLNNVIKVYEQTGTVWENYAPERTDKGCAKPDFVGWTGLPPIAVLFEYVFGITPNVPKNKLVWNVRLLEEHGIRNYPFGKDGLLDLHCAGRKSQIERPQIKVFSNMPIQIYLFWNNNSEIIDIS